MRRQLVSNALTWLCILIATLCWAVPEVTAQVSQQEEREIMAAYNAAIYDSSVYKFSNLRPLYPLTFDSNTNTATVVTLTSYPYQEGSMTLTKDVWVSVVPEVQKICQNFTGDIALRLKQLLGLHPLTRFTHFVPMIVRRGDVFRPTADPETTSSLPCACPIPARCGEVFPSNVEARHVRWLADQMLNSYVISESTLIPVGYPWTRLGYTYDWRPGSNKYGASEYVIRQGATVTVMKPIPFEAYCSSSK